MFSMCSELTPRAPIPDTRIPQLMQPCAEYEKYAEYANRPQQLTPGSIVPLAMFLLFVIIIIIIGVNDSLETALQHLFHSYATDACSQNRHSTLGSVGPLAMLVYQLLKVIEARLQYFMSVWFLVTCSCGPGWHTASFFPLYKLHLAFV